MERLCKIGTLNRNLMEELENTSYIDPGLYKKYDVKRGLRNANGTGVLVGITNVADVQGYTVKDNKKISMEGKLYYRGIDLDDICAYLEKEDRFGYEETVFLLLFGSLPSRSDLALFEKLLDENRTYPSTLMLDLLIKNPSVNLMNKLQRAVLSMHSYDDKPDENSLENNAVQSLNLIAKIPTIVAYTYHSAAHYYSNKSLIIHNPLPGKSTAENFLHMIRDDGKYTDLEAKLLDLCMTLHADHGGGNNSAFAMHVVSSTGTDIYSALSASIGSLKGPKHGGANLKVMEMIRNIKENCDYNNEKKLTTYIRKMLDGKVFDKKGLVYGMGHAVYTLSDPRKRIMSDKALKLARIKNLEDEYNLIENVENITKKIFKEERGKDICANIDMYSGFIYKILDLPESIYTPIFAMSRLAGWCAHRLEQIRDNKIIRPAYITNVRHYEYTSINEREDVIK